MDATLVFLGRLADLAGSGEQAVASGPLADVLAGLPVALALALTEERVRWALNGQLVSRESVPILAEGDELAFLPPVSGG
jgi:molybdopterin synthase sulfur carrier subunit